MIVSERLNRLAERLRREKADALFLGPSPDLEYLSGLCLFADERFKGLGVLSDGRTFALVPRLYGEEMERQLGPSVPRYVWDDAEGFLGAWSRAVDDLGLRGARIAVNDGVRACDMLDAGEARPAVFLNGVDYLAPIRRRKDAEEVARMVVASELADRVVEGLAATLRPGLREGDVVKRIGELFEEFGADGQSFSPIVASGPNGSMPHYGGKDRVLQEGDFVICDLGGRKDGYCSDTTRTFCLGEPTARMREVYEVVLRSQMAGEAAVAPGVPAQEVDRAARRVIEEAGYGAYFLNRVGHGIGVAVHEAPFIKEGNAEPLEPGDVFSVEPGIYLPGDWGMRLEDIVVATAAGPSSMNHADRALVVLG